MTTLGLDYTLVWDVATNKLPELRVKLQALLELTENFQQSAVSGEQKTPAEE